MGATLTDAGTVLDIPSALGNNHVMTTTTNLLFNSYTVQTAEPTMRCGGISGEFILTGKRGATYRTWRRADEAHVQFTAESGKFCALAGNYHLGLALVASHAVELTDADRVVTA